MTVSGTNDGDCAKFVKSIEHLAHQHPCIPQGLHVYGPGEGPYMVHPKKTPGLSRWPMTLGDEARFDISQ